MVGAALALGALGGLDYLREGTRRRARAAAADPPWSCSGWASPRSSQAG